MSASLIEQAKDLALCYDVVVVGAGPAGLCAATELAEAGLTVLVLDENPAPGGQIYRAITQHPKPGREYLGDAYWAGEPVATAFLRAPLQYAARARVWSLDPASARDDQPCARIGVSLGGVALHIQTKRVILATGAIERPTPVPGWTLPGVMTAGAAQIALKSAGLVPCGRVVLAGCGPLLYQLAIQMHEAGAEIVALLDTAPGVHVAWRYLPEFLCSAYAIKGALLLAKAKRVTRVVSGVQQIAIGGEQRAEHIRFRTEGREETLQADLVLLHQGVIPEIALANSAGCALQWNPSIRAFQAQLDARGRSSLADIFIAGDGARIGGALASAESGRAVALAVLGELDSDNAQRYERRLHVTLNKLSHLLRGRTFIDKAYLPVRAFLAPADDATVVCRCEEVRAGTVRDVARRGTAGPNQMKAFTRCGMGPCQGRQCSTTVTELLADELGVSPAEVGTYRLRPPIKPLRLAELAALPASPAATHAVTGLWPENIQH